MESVLGHGEIDVKAPSDCNALVCTSERDFVDLEWAGPEESGVDGSLVEMA
jgi:hypothetical protein